MAGRALRILGWTVFGALGAMALAFLALCLNPSWVNRPAERWVKAYLEQHPLADSARLSVRSVAWKPLLGLELRGVELRRGLEGVYVGTVELDGLGRRNGRWYAETLRLDSVAVTGIPGGHWAEWFAPWSDPNDTTSSALALELGEVQLGFWAQSLEGDTLIGPSRLQLSGVVWESNALQTRAHLELELPAAAGSVVADLRMLPDTADLQLRWGAYQAQAFYQGDNLKVSLEDTSSNKLSIRALNKNNSWILPAQEWAWGEVAVRAQGSWSGTRAALQLEGSGLRANLRLRDEVATFLLRADSTQLPEGSKWTAHGSVKGRYESGAWSLQGSDLIGAVEANRMHVTELALSGSRTKWQALLREARYGELSAEGDYALESVRAQWAPETPLRAGLGLPSLHRLDARWSVSKPFNLGLTAFDSLQPVGSLTAAVQKSFWDLGGSLGGYQLKARFGRLPDRWNVPELTASALAEQALAGRLALLDSLGFASLDLTGPELQLHLAHEPSGTVGTAWWQSEGRRADWIYRATARSVRHELTWRGGESASLRLEAAPGDSLRAELRGLADHSRGGQIHLSAQIWPHGTVWDGGLRSGSADAWYRPESGDSVRLNGVFRGGKHFSYDFENQRLAFSDPLYWTSPEGQIAVGGALSPSDGEVLRLQARNVDVPFWSRVAGLGDLDLGGTVGLDAVVVGQISGWAVSGGLRTDSLSLKRQSLGQLNVDLDYVAERREADLAVHWAHDDTVFLNLQGQLSAEGLSAKTKQLSIPLRWARPFAEGSVDDLNGRLQGRVQLSANADFSNFKVDGSGFWSSAHLRLPTVGLGLTGTAPWVLNEKSLKLGPARFGDHRGVGSAEISAKVSFTGSELVDLSFKTERMLVLDLPPSRNADFYGYMVASGSGRLHGSSRALRLDVRAKSVDSSVFALPLDAPVSLDEVSFLNFRARNEAPKPRKRTNDDFAFDVHLDLDVTQDVRARLILDETLGDVIEARGSGPIQLDVPWVGDMALRGSLSLDRGTYLFTLGNLINKPFNLVPGGTIRWTGDPYAAQMNLTARYRTRADVGDYLGLPEAGRQNIDVGLRATGPLFQPQLAFDVAMPNAGEVAKAALSSRMSYADERTTQVLSLLTISSFWLGSSPLSAQGMQAVESNTTQVLASQFTNFVTQGLGADWDVNLAYSTNSAAAQREMEASIGRRFLDDRLSIQTEWGIPIGQTQPSIGLGDVEVRYQLSEDGRWSAKAYQRRNDRTMQTGVVGSQRQGIGVRFEQSGSTWRQLLQGEKR
jgi:hypothetical protein